MSAEYKTLRKAARASFTEKRSEFIGSVLPCSDEESALNFIKEIRAEHRRATHNCYAYILRENNTARHSDDGEPSGTAGKPILEIFQKAGITDLCCVVTRYFGGILLGAGGLVRAYANGAKIALEAAGIKTLTPAAKISLRADYSDYGKIPPLAAEFGAEILSEDFTDAVNLTVMIKSELKNDFKAKLTDASRGKIKITGSEKTEFDFDRRQ